MSVRGHRGVVLVAALLSLLWIAACGWAGFRNAGTLPDAPAIIMIVAVASLPLLVLWVAMLAIRPPPDPARMLAASGDEGTLAAAAARLGAMRETLATDLSAIAAATDALELRARDSSARLGGVVVQLNDAMAGVTAHDAALHCLASRAADLTSAAANDTATAHARLIDQETALTALWAAHDERHALALGQAAALRDELERLGAMRAHFTAGIGAEHDRLHHLAEQAFTATADATSAVGDAIGAHTAAIMGSVDNARAAFAAIGGEAARAAEDRLASLASAASELTGRLAAQERQAHGLSGIIERGFAVLDAKLGHAATATGGVLDGLNSRLSAAQATIQTLGAPLAAIRDATAEVETRVAALKAVGLETVDVLADAIPRRAAVTVDMIDQVRAAAAQAGAEAARIGTAAEAARAPVEATHDAARAAQAAFADQARALETAGQAVCVELGQARALALDVEQIAGSAALAAGTRLTDALAAAHRVADEAADATRATLAAIITETRDTLARAATASTDAQYAAPLRAVLADMEASAARAANQAQAAVERITQSLATLGRAAAIAQVAAPEVQRRRRR